MPAVSSNPISQYVELQRDGEIRQITMGVQAVVAADITAVLQDALLEVTAKTAMSWIAFLEASEQGIAEIRTGMARANAKIAIDVRKAILERFDETSLHTPEYRASAKHDKNIRYTGGVLRRVLASEGFVQSDADGIYMGDVAVLDDAARQWARLNYGAGGAGSGGGSTATGRISDIDITLSDPTGPRPGFNLPAGRWFGREFYPISELDNQGALSGGRARHRGRFGSNISSARPTRGIRAQHWTDAGLQVIAEQIGPAYLAMFKDLWQNATTTARQAYTGTQSIHRFSTPGTDSATVLHDASEEE